jgi:hypothetical protein
MKKKSKRKNNHPGLWEKIKKSEMVAFISQLFRSEKSMKKKGEKVQTIRAGMCCCKSSCHKEVTLKQISKDMKENKKEKKK